MRYLSKIALVLLTVAVTDNKIGGQSLGKPSLIKEPYPYISSGSFSNRPLLTESPDPVASYRWTKPKATDGLEIFTLRPVKVTTENASSFHNLKTLTGDSPNVAVTGTGSVMLDFGCENAAWLEFDSPDLVDTVEMSISEYNQPAMVNTGAQNPVKTKRPVKYGNTYRLELNKELYEGVRFGWIHVGKCSKPWHITGIRLVCQIKPTNYNGSFSCSDPLLNQIWYTGAYTVKLNLQKDYFGAILMERSDRFSWTGDAYPAQAASMVAFGNYDFIKTNLKNTSVQSNGIEGYSLYWVLSLIDYYNYTGDATTLGIYIDNACAKLNNAYSHYGTNPKLGFYGWDERLGAGFENPDISESENAYKMLTIRTWSEFSKAMKQYGRTDLYEKYKLYADSKINELRQDSGWYDPFGLHAGADAVNAGFLTINEQDVLYKKEFSDRVNRLSFSPFNQYSIIQSMAIMDKYDDAISCIKDLWGGQIKYGGTTFFEVYNHSWNNALSKNDAPINEQNGYTSLCHPWSAGVTKWLTEEILGIKPVNPGFSTYDILPHLGRSLTHVAGTVRTPYGEISARFNVKSGICKVVSPAKTLGRIGIPKVEKEIKSIRINGKLVWIGGKYNKTEGISGANEDHDFVYFSGVEPGSYNFSVSYNGTTPAYKELPWKYAATFLKEDATTSGNWGGAYGNSGYILCNYTDSLHDIRNLPSYVASVNYKKNRNSRWAVGVSDKRAPAADTNNSFPRNVGCIHTNDPAPCDQTMTVDIVLEQPKTYQIALYFVDWDNKGRTTAVEIFDLQTKNLIAPVKVVRDYFGGKYLVFKYNKSVRFRIDQVRGVNAALSGIFFD